MSEDRKQLRKLAGRATPGPWELQTSNSWRRIGTAGGRFADGDVLAPTTHRGDSHPDLAARQEDLDFIVAADPATVLALLDELEAANANHENAAAHMQSVCAERDRLKAENAELRQILSECATACGAGMSPECSLTFMSGLPEEIRLNMPKGK